MFKIFPCVSRNLRIVRSFRVFILIDRASMKSPLASKNFSHHIKRLRAFLNALFVALILPCAVSAQDRIFYPHVLDNQLWQIVESSADEVQPLQEICATLLENLNAVVTHIEQNPEQPCPAFSRFEESVRTLDVLRTSWSAKGSDREESYVPSTAALEEITLALQRRVYIWRALLKAEEAEASPVTTLYDKSFSDVDRLKERTIAVEQYFTRSRRTADYKAGLTWCDYLETQSWLTELEACRQPAVMPIRLVSTASPAISVEMLTTLSGRANTTIHRLESPTLTNEQRAFLNHPTVKVWKEELQSWMADTVTPVNVLRFLEQYEATGGMSDMRALSRFIEQLTMSKTAEYQQLGESVRRQYGMPNVRFFLSGALLNNHLPPAVSEIASFRDVIQSQPTVGRRQTETEMEVSLIPHPTRVLTALDVGVDLATISRSDAFATQLFSTGRALIIARKTIELTENGFLTEPCEARIVGHQMRLARVDTDFDGVPVLSGLFRGVVFNQYESKSREARTEIQRKMIRQVRNQIDRETAIRLQPINERIKILSQYADEEFDLQVEKRDSRTAEDWLITAWGIRSKDALSSCTPAPETQSGSFADVKIHESLPNMLLGKLEFEGKQGTVAEFKAALAEKFRQPALAKPEENDHVEVTFASYNPVVVRFVDGRIELTISIASLRLLGQTHRNFQVIVWYKPAYDSEGRLVLERDGYISLVNVRVREQFVMRAAFGKIFPVSRPLPLVPKVLENDPQFEYLTTGHCRIEKGWLALALVEKPEQDEASPTQ